MKEYKRFTERTEHGGVKFEGDGYIITCYPQNEHCLKPTHKMAIRLAELEDKIENGTLIELPCDIGTEVYFIREKYGQYKICYGNVEYFRLERTFKGREIEKRLMVGIRKLDRPYGTNYHRADELNNLWFLTKAEAEAKLKELKGEV